MILRTIISASFFALLFSCNKSNSIQSSSIYFDSTISISSIKQLCDSFEIIQLDYSEVILSDYYLVAEKGQYIEYKLFNSSLANNYIGKLVVFHTMKSELWEFENKDEILIYFITSNCELDIFGGFVIGSKIEEVIKHLGMPYINNSDHIMYKDLITIEDEPINIIGKSINTFFYYKDSTVNKIEIAPLTQRRMQINSTK